MTITTQTYTEESFGILTDDDLYLDCILVRPPNIPDENLRAIRVWVPKYPLTKSSVIVCARQEVHYFGDKHKIAHLTFDLRGTGQSEGVMGDENFDMDLHAVREWAKERFGKIKMSFMGTPYSENGRVNLWPLRKGSLMESYHYPATSSQVTPPTIFYMSTYGSFSRSDDLICTRLAQAGYDVYGADPLRYLLHASAQTRIRPEDLQADLQIFIQMLPKPPVILAQPLAAGLGLIWASRVQQIKGIVAIGRAQAGLSPQHIFHNQNPYNYLLSRHVKDIAPNPVAFVRLANHSLGGDEKELATLYQSSHDPHRLESVEKLRFKFITDLLEWTLS